MKRHSLFSFLLFIVFFLSANLCLAQRTLAPSPNLMSSSSLRVHMTAVYKSLLHEDSYQFIIITEEWKDSQSIIVLKSDGELVYRKAKKHINRRKVTTTSSGIRIDDSLSLILCDLVEAAVHSASYNDYNQPNDGITYYYVINGKAAIHHYPWPDFPIENPEINNIRRLWDIYEAIVRTIVSHNPETSSELKDDIISLTASFLKP